jgi:hypothetical protein
MAISMYMCYANALELELELMTHKVKNIDQNETLRQYTLHITIHIFNNTDDTQS